MGNLRVGPVPPTPNDPPTFPGRGGGTGLILAILVGSHLGNIPTKFESHWPKGSGGVSF